MRPVFLCFYCAPNKGSEWQVGFDLLSFCISSNLRVEILVSKDSFFDLKEHFNVVSNKKELVINTVKVRCGGFRKIKAKSSTGHRIYFYTWLIINIAMLLPSRRKVILNNFVQILTPFIFFMIFKKNWYTCPLGGQVSQKNKHFAFSEYKLFFQTKILNKLVKTLFLTDIRKRTAVNHPLLGAEFNLPFYPAISYRSIGEKKEIKEVDFYQRKRILIIGRNIRSKNPKVTLELVKRLASIHGGFDFYFVGDGWGNFKANEPNIYFYDKLKQPKLFELLSETRLHIFISDELAGYVALEAAAMNVPTLVLADRGADYLVKPSEKFRLQSLEQATSNSFVLHVSDILNSDKALFAEGCLQKGNASEVNWQNRRSFLTKIYKNDVFC